MRKIEKAEIIEAKNRVRTRWLTIMILGLLVLSSAGYAFFANPDSGTKKTSNGLVQDIGGAWAFQYSGQSQQVQTSPDEVRNISVEIVTSLQTFSGAIVYYDISNQGIAYEIVSNLARYTGRMQPACYGNCSLGLPQKDCSQNMIVWNQSSVNRVYQRQNCVFIEGDMKSADAFIYKLFGLS